MVSLAAISVLQILWISCSKSPSPDLNSGELIKPLYISLSASTQENDEVITGNAFLTEINDLNIFVYDQYGYFTQHYYIPVLFGSPVFYTTLDRVYVYAVANWGSNLNSPIIFTKESLENRYFEFPGAAELESRKVMTGLSPLTYLYSGLTIPLSMKRTYSKLTVVFDKSQLDPNVSVNVTKIEVRNNATRVGFFSGSKAQSVSQINPAGDFITNPIVVSNHENAQYLRLSENMQGNLLPGNNDQKLKIPPVGFTDLCTYAEITANYDSPIKSGTIRYRIYLGSDETKNFDIKRNTWYKMTVRFKGSTLNETSWRIDTSQINNKIGHIELDKHNISFNSLNYTASLICSHFPQTASPPQINWYSTDQSIATVSQNGVVTSKNYGSCKVVAYVSNLPSVRDTCDIVVNFINPIKLITSISFNESSINLIYKQPEPHIVNYTITPSDAGNKVLLWQSSNNSIAIVDQAGKITPVSTGNCIITASSTDGSGVSAQLNVTVDFAQPTAIEIVEDYDQFNDITIPAKSVVIDKKLSDGISGSARYKVKVLPSNANQNINVTWSLIRIANNTNSMATLSTSSDGSVVLNVKELVNVSSNRGELKIRATAGSFTTSIIVRIFEKVPLRFSWSNWILPGYENGVEGIVPSYATHNTITANSYIPNICVVSKSQFEYWGPQPGELWTYFLLPSTYQDFLYEFSEAIIHPGSEYSIENNCFYTIAQ